jgi:putative endopeptidase
MKKLVWIAAASAGALAAAGAVWAQSAGAVSVPPAPHYGTWGFDAAGEDKAVVPGSDFFDYANGDALAKMVIPPDRTSFGPFTELAELSLARVHAILEEAAAHTPAEPATADEKIGAYYRSYMDEARINALGAKPLAADLQAIRAVPSKAAMAALMGRANDGYFASVIDVSIDTDEKNPDRYAVHLSQSGLGLPDRDYYLKPDFAAKKALYQQYVAQMLGLIGWSDPGANAAKIVQLETEIAQASWAKEDERDPDKIYNPMSLAQVEAADKGFDWAPFMQAADLGGTQRVVEQENTAIARIAGIYAATPLDTLKAWEAFHVASSAAPYLSEPFVQAHFEMYNKGLSGQPQIQVRWKRGVQAVDAGMGEAVGQVYVARYFPPESKAKMQALVADLKAAFRVRIEHLTWMGPETKAQALKKLDGYTVKIGYPDHFRDYSRLMIRADDLSGNMERSQAFEWARQVRRMNGPVDKSEWGMTPQTVNAYNNPVWNEVVFPAAILQPPFFDPHADPAVNFGAIGGVIGHEMTHGFDDEGRKFDYTGRLRDWWTAADAQRFEERASRLGAQYDTYAPLPGGGHVNGKLTMGENIADSGGINLALDAYHTSLNGAAAPTLGGYTGDQRVFLGWAQVWREKYRDDLQRQLLVTDPHSPPRFRVNGVVRNVDAWYPAFNVKPGEALYLPPDQRAHIW